MLYWIVSILLFAATSTFVVAFVQRRRERDTRSLRDRIGAVSEAHEAAAPRLERDERLSSIPAIDRMLRALSLARRIELLLYQAGMGIRVGAFLLLVAFFAAAAYVVGITVFHRVLHASLMAVLSGFLPFMYAQHRKSSRMRAFAEEFPDALDLLVSALRAGISFSAALQIVADESPEPIRSEFAIVVEEQALGLELREALNNLAHRIDSLDLKFFVTAVVLQRDTGGNLTEVLENTGRLIRDRFRILGDIMTFTAQGRLTGVILSLLPISMALFMLMVAPEYFRKMWDLPAGRAVLGFAGLMQILGALTIRKIVDIKV